MAFAAGTFLAKDVKVEIDASTQAVTQTVVTFVTANSSDPNFFLPGQEFQMSLKGGGYPIAPGNLYTVSLG